MTLTLEIPPETEAALQEKAQRRGLSLDAYLLDLAKRDASTKETASSRLAAVRAIGSYDTRRAAGLPPLSDAEISRESIYGERGL
jgi:hypothetical protein